MFSDLASSAKACIDWLDYYQVNIPRPVLVDACKYFKTYDYFLRVLSGDVVDLYRGNITEAQFVDNLAALLDQQLRRAFNEGMRQNGLDPQNDMTDEWEQAYQEIVSSEYQYVDGFAADIVKGAKDNTGYEQFQARAALWANRYNDVVNQAVIITAEGKDRLEWHLGQTEKHCETCKQLDGIVAFAAEWDTAGLKPQSPPNDALECGGWKCDCSLMPTDKRRSPNALNTLLNIGTKI